MLKFACMRIVSKSLNNEHLCSVQSLSELTFEAFALQRAKGMKFFEQFVITCSPKSFKGYWTAKKQILSTKIGEYEYGKLITQYQ